MMMLNMDGLILRMFWGLRVWRNICVTDVSECVPFVVVPILSSFMTYHRIFNKSGTSCVTSGAGTAYPSWTSEYTVILSGVRVVESVMCSFCRALFVSLSLFFCYVSVLQFTSSYYSFCILSFWYIHKGQLCIN